MTIRAVEPVLVIATRLGEIAQASGYHYDVGTVHRGREMLGDSDLPAISIVESEEGEASAEVTGDAVLETIEYEIRALVKADPSNPLDDAHAIAADIKRALFRAADIEGERLDDTATSVEYTGRRVIGRDTESGSAYAQAHVFVRVTHAEALGAPDTAP